MSPPLPLIQRTFRLAPSSGSASRIFELVFPTPKFVMRKSDPKRLDRYRSNSGASKLRATFSSHLSSRYRNFSEVFMISVEQSWLFPGSAILRQSAIPRLQTLLNRRKIRNRLIISDHPHGRVTAGRTTLRRGPSHFVDTDITKATSTVSSYC